MGIAVAGNISSIRTQVDDVRSSGAGWVSLNLGWSLYEPVPDAYEGSGNAAARWQQLGETLRYAKSRGLRVLVTFKSTPYWARPVLLRNERNAPPDAGAFGAYADFLGDVARAYGAHIDAYATWNEPNIDQFWKSPDPAAYAEVHRLAASEVRAADRGAKVLLGPFAGNAPGSFDYLIGVYARGVRGTLDAVGWNSYPTREPEYGISSLDEQFRLAGHLRRLDPGRRVWLTELGWSTCTQCGTFNATSPAKQADYLLRSYSYRRRYLAGFVDRLFWYNLADGQDARSWSSNHGLRYSNLRPKPSYRALSRLSSELAPPTRLRHAARSGATSLAVTGISSRRGQIRVGVRAERPTTSILRIDGFWRGRWRPIQRKAIRGKTSLRMKIRDRGYRAIRVRTSIGSSRWLDAGRIVPNAPRLSSNRTNARTNARA